VNIQDVEATDTLTINRATRATTSATTTATPAGFMATQLQRVAFYVPAVAILAMWAARAFDLNAENRDDREEGASVLEWVLIVAITAVLVVGIGVILTMKFTDKANSINLDS
jgi:NADH:ubiquinone oxidoreductase subunit 6 (subunit J)